MPNVAPEPVVRTGLTPGGCGAVLSGPVSDTNSLLAGKIQAILLGEHAYAFEVPSNDKGIRGISLRGRTGNLFAGNRELKQHHQGISCPYQGIPAVRAVFVQRENHQRSS
jgi:hypothetical protein